MELTHVTKTTTNPTLQAPGLQLLPCGVVTVGVFSDSVLPGNDRNEEEDGSLGNCLQMFVTLKISPQIGGSFH